jgi:AhpD family alkylhydroperoxidase
VGFSPTPVDRNDMTEKIFQHPSDRQFARQLAKAAPVEASTYQTFSHAVVHRADGVIPPKVREMIAVGVALTTQCSYCLETHTGLAQKHGVTPEELAEIVYIASALKAGAAAAHGMLAMKLYMHAADAATAAAAPAGR